MSSPSRIDAVVVTRDTREITLRCVRTLFESISGSGVELALTVVDNASSDGTSEALGDQWPEVRILVNEGNVGYGAACNQGLRGGSGELVLILNSDVFARPGAVRELVDFMRGHPGHVGAGARLVDAGTDSVQVGHAARALPHLLPQLAQMAGFEKHWPQNPVSRRYLGLDLDYDRTQDIEQPPGSCLICRRVDFDALGGFDERFFYWYEDVDLARRLRDRGRLAYVSDATFEHMGSATFAGWARPESILSWYTGLQRYFAKHRPRREQLALRGFTVLASLVREAIVVFRDREQARAWRRVRALALRGIDQA